MAGYSSRHIEFAHELAKGATIYDAAIKAGFSPTTANKKAHTWVGKSREDSKYPELWDMVQEIREAAKDETIDEIGRLKEAWEKIAFDGILVTKTPYGDVDRPIEFEATRVKALENLGKIIGAYTKKVEHSGPGGGPIESTNTLQDFSGLSGDEKFQLFELMKKARVKEED